MDPVLPVLEGRVLRLEPLEARHREPLRAACDADPEIWVSHYPFPMNGPALDDWWARLEVDAARGARAGFAVVAAGSSAPGAVVGCSLYILDPANRRVEIGNTYYRPEARGGPVNPETKRLMLAHAFTPGALWAEGALVVQFRVDARNARSRAAVAKLGAHLDGVLRHDRITWTGRVRDTCVFSITAAEWPAVRAGLDARLEGFAPA